MIKHLKNQSGFTLIEVMVVGTILLIVLGALGSFMVSNTTLYVNSRNDTDAQEQAVLVMNRLVNGIPSVVNGSEILPTGILAAQRINSITVDEFYHISALTLVESDAANTLEFYRVSGNQLTYERSGTVTVISDSVDYIRIRPIANGAVVTSPLSRHYLGTDGEPAPEGVEIEVRSVVPAGASNAKRATISNQVFFRNAN